MGVRDKIIEEHLRPAGERLSNRAIARKLGVTHQHVCQVIKGYELMQRVRVLLDCLARQGLSESDFSEEELAALDRLAEEVGGGEGGGRS